MKDGFLIVNWLFPGNHQLFNLAYNNSRTSNVKEDTINGTRRINNTHQYAFTVGDLLPCDMLEVIVTTTSRGRNGNRAAITGVLPPLPDIDTVRHTLFKKNTRLVTLTVTFTVCY